MPWAAGNVDVQVCAQAQAERLARRREEIAVEIRGRGNCQRAVRVVAVFAEGDRARASHTNPQSGVRGRRNEIARRDISADPRSGYRQDAGGAAPTDVVTLEGGE